MSDPCQADMFGHEPAQSQLFEAQVCEPSKNLTADDIREEMLALLAQAHAAETMPWTPRQIRSHTAMFP